MSLKGERSAARERASVLALIERMRAVPLLRECPIVMMVEALPGIAAAHIYTYVQDQPNLVYMHERVGNAEGVPKNNDSTNDMKDEFETLMQQNNIRFANDVITYDIPFEKERDKLFTQIENMRYEALPRANDHDEQKFKVTAKIGGRSDDLLVALMMVPYWKRRFWRSKSPRYEEAKRRISERFYGAAAARGGTSGFGTSGGGEEI